MYFLAGEMLRRQVGRNILLKMHTESHTNPHTQNHTLVAEASGTHNIEHSKLLETHT
jgi:hypothetical protein